jgi:hypothetical protein
MTANQEIPLFIRRVMPRAIEAELLEATETFHEYMAIVWRIAERLWREKHNSDSPKGSP